MTPASSVYVDFESDVRQSALPEDPPLGTLYGIGVGPGDPEWITVKGLRLLQSVQVVAVPQNRQGEPGLAFAIAQQYLRPHQTLITLKLPFTTNPAQLEAGWGQSMTTLMPHLRAGRNVAFLAEGDISFYSTFSHVARSAQQREPGLTIETVPGVCAPLAAASALNIPLSLWHEKVAILPALYEVSELDHALDWAEVVILMKVGSVFDLVWNCLSDRNLLDHACLVEWVGWPQQKTWVGWQDLQGYKPPYFSVAIIKRELDSAPFPKNI
ncbi:MAG: precorrin-2 C(20)-methyltransferase [Cyanobacteria bacterium P01_F01_bin.153]